MDAFDPGLLLTETNDYSCGDRTAAPPRRAGIERNEVVIAGWFNLL